MVHAILCVMIVLALAAMAPGQERSPAAAELLAKAQKVLEQKDTFALVELLNDHDPLLAARVYEQLQGDLYWKARDIPKVVAVSRAGIQHGLTQAKGVDPKAADALRNSVKAMAYNLASFTWPGWNEKGIVLTASDLAVGLDAARLNLRLAEQLNKPAKAKADAYWVLGAQQLAAGQHARAGESFAAAKAQASEAKDALMVRMLDGYAALVRLVANPNDADAQAQFNRAVDTLHKDPSEDAKVYADQLPVALEVFQGKGK